MPKPEEIPTYGSLLPGEKMVKVTVVGQNYHTPERVYMKGDQLIVPERFIELSTSRRFEIGSATTPIVCRALAPSDDPEAVKVRLEIESSPRNMKAIEGERARLAAQKKQQEEQAAINRKLNEDEARQRGFVPVREAAAGK